MHSDAAAVSFTGSMLLASAWLLERLTIVEEGEWGAGTLHGESRREREKGFSAELSSLNTGKYS
ncbi:DCUN1D4 isoform 5 [Pongo abelii]|uniref:DCUN1D4 isoform 5 n=1 Tax=Pongo abelii TaxID=9601 RepID=A0A2J8SGG2_PONAB|nr:DCUN1D4 isoform 5 [Pongo abelii]